MAHSIRTLKKNTDLTDPSKEVGPELKAERTNYI
jgi:hypothetical protein